MYAYRYVKTEVKGDDLLADFGNRFRFVGQRKYPGNSEKGLESGAIVTLMITEDHSKPVIDKDTGLERENSVYETFDVTIPGVSYPLPIKKGEYVKLGEFMPEASWFINNQLILRYKHIEKIPELQKGAVNHVAGKE